VAKIDKSSTILISLADGSSGNGLPSFWYAGHDASFGVEVSKEPVRRNPKAKDKVALARAQLKEVRREIWRTRTASGYEDLTAGKSVVQVKISKTKGVASTLFLKAIMHVMTPYKRKEWAQERAAEWRAG
jgi:hypothetical protein